jgi:hypothetical protein
MESSWNENRAELQGNLAAKPSFSYESHGIRYFLFPLSVNRLSGAADVLNVVVAQPLLSQLPPGDHPAFWCRGKSVPSTTRAGWAAV